MNLNRRFGRLIACLVVVSGLFLLSGCQGLLGGSNGTNGVTLGSASLDFGSVPVGTTKTMPNTLTNNTASPITLSSILGLGYGFKVTGVTTPLVVAAGQSVSFNVQFQPTNSGDPKITISFDGQSSQTPMATLTVSGQGVSIGRVSPSPSPVAFGNTKVGSNQRTTVTLTNSGGTDVTINQATLSGAGFAMSNLAVPLTLSAGATNSVTITFAPTSATHFTGSVTFATTANQQNSNVVLNLSGDGVTPGTLSPNPASLAFGSVQVGSSSSQSETLTNTGGSSVTISQATASGAGFSITGLGLPATLASNQTVTFTTTFTPASAGAASGTVSIVSDASNSPLSIALSGTGLAAGSLTANPSSASFGNVTLGTNKTIPVTVTNTGGTAVTVSGAAAAGSGFSFTGPSLPITLNAGQATTFNSIFTPAAAGAVSGTMTINSNASNATLSVPLSGTGVTAGQLGSNPSSFSFGSVQDGTSKSLAGTLTNSGGTSLTISAAAASGAGFSLSGLSLPLTLNAGQSTSFAVLFAPTASGAATGNVSITSNGSNPNLSIPLSGTGVTPGTLTASPTSLAFGSVQVGSSTSLSETLTNSGGSSLTLSAAAASGSGFSLSGLSLPLTLTAGQSSSFTVHFAPTTSGAVSGNVTVTSNASNPSLSIPLSGTGLAAGALTPNPTSLAFGSVQIGSSTSLSETLTNSGGASLTISAANATGGGFSLSGLSLPLTLTAGQSTSFTVLFAPTVSGAASGSVSITSNGSNPNLSIPLSGTGLAPGLLTANPVSLAFGSVQVGANKSLSETLTNTGGVAVTISQANPTGAAFSVSGLTLPTTLTANQSVTFTVIFAPSGAGAASGSLSVVSNATNSPLAIALTGTGTAPGQLAVSPTSLSFGSVLVGASSSLNGNLSASGASVTVSSGSLSNGEFVVSGISLPATIAAGQSASFTVTFTPQASGASSGTLTFMSNATNSPTVQTMTGTGTPPIQHTVDLTWNPASNAVGYNIYRGTVSGGPYTMINGSLDGTTAYTDNTVVSGQTYYYVATAVDSSSNESGYSNQAQAVVPTP